MVDVKIAKFNSSIIYFLCGKIFFLSLTITIWFKRDEYIKRLQATNFDANHRKGQIRQIYVEGKEGFIRGS